ncbi:MAG: SEC-C metal-binding domain-containing protein, partial [Thermodesulfovibrionales bacterium]
AIISEIEEHHKKGQPVLVGTISIEKSEHLSHLLKKKGVKHSVLNAKYHEREAEIVAQAGRKGAVTIATNMAGRGTDIVLGGNPEGIAREMLSSKETYTDDEYKAVLKSAKEMCEKEKQEVISLGGLHIIGTERHEARRIDNQLRGRSGRQGDPGSSRFYLSLEDDLMRIFGSDKINGLMNMLKMDESVPIENKMVSKAIENAQKRVEAHNFDIRKHLLEYDDVMNKQRKEIYSFRREVLLNPSVKDRLYEMVEDQVDDFLAVYCPEDSDYTEWDINGLTDSVYGICGVEYLPPDNFRSADELFEHIVRFLKEVYEKKEASAGPDFMRYIEKMIFLQVIDTHWKNHLLAIDHLKEGIGLRGYAQRDPLVEYKKEAFNLFSTLSDRIRTEIISRLFKIQIKVETAQEIQEMSHQRAEQSRISDAKKEPTKKDRKIGRNDPCPCGSGKKFKKCCGMN